MPQVQTQPHVQSDFLVSLNTGQYLLAQKDLALVDHLGAVFPLPWCPSSLIGLVLTELGPVPLMDWSGAGQKPAIAPKLVLILRTDKGLLAVAAHAIEEVKPSAGMAEPYQDLCQAVADLSGDFQVARLSSNSASSWQATQLEQFLRVRSASKEVLVRASEIKRIGKHAGAVQLEPGNTMDWVARLDDDLLAARSLGTIYQTGISAANEPWCLDTIGHGCQAVLVEEVLGFVEASARQLKTLHHAGRSSHWVMREDETPIELLSMAQPAIDAFAQVSPAAAQPSSEVPPHLVDTPVWRVQAQDALSLSVGRCKLVFPAHAVRSVLGHAKDMDFCQVRSPHALPVLDLRRLLAGPDEQTRAMADDALATHVVLGGRQLVLLSQGLAAVSESVGSADAAWHAVPALPGALHAFLRAIRLGTDSCELLIQTQHLGADRDPATRSRIKAAFAGWYTVPTPAVVPENISQA
jgi:hypothetical protein